MIKYSFIIPGYNCASTILHSLSSILLLKDEKFQVIFIDDCSSDNTVELLKNYSSEIQIVRVKNRKGPAHARNRGVRLALGEIVVFVDSDVCVPADCLIKLDAHFSQQDVSAVQMIYAKECTIRGVINHYENLYQFYNFFRVKTPHLESASTFAFAIRKCCFIPFQEDLLSAEDGIWGSELFHKGNKIILDKTLQVIHLKDFSLSSFVYRCLKMGYYKGKLLFEKPRQITFNHSATHHSKGKMLSILLSPFPFLFPLPNFKFFFFIVKERGLKFLVLASFFHWVKSILFLSGLLGGSLSQAIRPYIKK